MKINPKLIENSQYLTSEKIIGNWIDGKPIYRKVIVTTNAQCQTVGTLVDKNVSVSDLTVDFMIDIKLILKKPNDFTGYGFVFGGNTPTQGTRCYYSDTNKAVVIRNSNTSYNNSTVYLTLEYTKTTD